MSGIDDKVLDNFFKETLGENKELLCEILQIYLQESPEFIAVMKKGVLENNIQIIQSVSHNLKSNSATIGAMKMHSLAKKIEEKCIHNEPSDLKELIEETDAEYKVLMPEIEKILS